MTETVQIPWTPDGALEVLTFGLGQETFAMEALLVREIVDLLPATAVPGAAPIAGHVVNFRGRVIPLADLRPAFGMAQTPATPDTRIVVVELPIGEESELIGLRTDKVDEVTTLHERDCEPPPALGMRWPRDHVRGLVRRQDDVIVLPDLDALFATHLTGR